MFKFKSKMLVSIILSCLLFFLSFSLIIRTAIFSVPVFVFHGILDVNNPQAFPSRMPKLDYSLQNLEKFLRYLIAHNYWFLSTQELLDYFILKSQDIPSIYFNKKPVVLTFDDGYKSIDVYLLPLLNQLQAEFNYPLKVVLFINPLQMQDDNSHKKVKYLNCENLKKGMQQGFYDIQSHGYSHRNLTKMTEEKLKFELTTSQKILQQCTEKIVGSEAVARHLAYPYNRVNKKVKQYTSKYYLSGYGANNYFRKLLILHSHLRIPRIGISQKDSPEKLIEFAQMRSRGD